MSRRSTKQRRAAARRTWLYGDAKRRRARQDIRDRGGFADVGDWLIAVRDAMVNGRIDPRLVPAEIGGYP